MKYLNKKFSVGGYTKKLGENWDRSFNSGRYRLLEILDKYLVLDEHHNKLINEIVDGLDNSSALKIVETIKKAKKKSSVALEQVEKLLNSKDNKHE